MMKEVANLIKSSNYCVSVTGAGISTGAGLSDYRGEGGKWNGYNPVEVCSIESDYSSDTFINFWKSMAIQVSNSYCTKAHVILQDWLRRYLVDKVITQNIDGYHGDHHNVHEIHGSISTFRCESCDKKVESLEYCLGNYKCPECGEYLRPDVVMFGETVPDMDSIEDILWYSQDNSILLVIGTSLMVDPLKTLVKFATDDFDKVVVINNELPPILEGLDNLIFLQGDIQNTIVELNSLIQ